MQKPAIKKADGLSLIKLIGMGCQSTSCGIDDTKQSVHLPTNPLNKFGYNIEFNNNGEYKNYTIDYEAMEAHIVALHKESKRQGHDLWRVIFDPELQPNLFKSKHGEYLGQNIQFSKKRVWVRHDEHYHVDFEVPCK